MSKVFCEECLNEKEYYVTEECKKDFIDGKEIRYVVKSSFCSCCDTELYVEEIMKSNNISYQDAIREVNGLIKVSEIKELLEKYSIGAKPLARMLKWGEVNILRYLSGSVPEKMYSNKLKRLLEKPEEMEKLLFSNKDLIPNFTYKKCKGALKEIELSRNHSKLYLTAKVIISKTPDITHLALQKLLYFLQGLSSSILEKPIFIDQPQVWMHGPVYPDIYHRYSAYQYNPLENESPEISSDDIDNFEEEEYKLINFIINCLGVYSGSVLAHLSHETEPWKNNQTTTNKEITLDELHAYFDKVTKKYNITLGDEESLRTYIESLKKGLL